jgi:hypothetical protein
MLAYHGQENLDRESNIHEWGQYAGALRISWFLHFTNQVA